MFGLIRQHHGCNETPNDYQFSAGLRHIVVSKLFRLSHISNCKEDKGVLLTQLKALPLSNLSQATERVPSSTSAAITEGLSESSEEESEDVLESNIVYCVWIFYTHIPKEKAVHLMSRPPEGK